MMILLSGRLPQSAAHSCKHFEWGFKDGVRTLECGGSTPLSFFRWRGTKERKKKESGVEPPHSKAGAHLKRWKSE
jgi:hypothetical protein